MGLPLDLYQHWELFVDHYLIDKLDGLSLKLAEPERAEVVLELDRPWEGPVAYYYSVLRDGDTIRMYYRGNLQGDDHSKEQVTCVAESRDGVHFERPSVGKVEFDGSTANNIVYRGVGAHNLAPFIDANPDCGPAQRYKAVGGEWAKLYAFASADGLHFERLRDEPVDLVGKFDSLNVAWWDEHTACYRAFVRDFVEQESGAVRVIQSATSPDLLHWSQPVQNRYDDGVPMEQFYTNNTLRCPGAPELFVAFPKRFLPGRKKVEEHAEMGLSDAVFMTSRDGVHWDRPFMEAWLRPGRSRRNWTDRNLGPAWGIVETVRKEPGGDIREWSMYVGEHYRWASNRVTRLVLRPHGFASLHGGYAGGSGSGGSGGSGGGEMISKPVRCSGSRLLLNYATSAAGGVSVALLDADRHVIPGYGHDDFTLLFGDELDAPATWAAGSDLSKLRNQPVRLHFKLNDADVFALRFAE